jgi:hypothetical protein
MEGKKKDFYIHGGSHTRVEVPILMWRFPYSCVLHRSRTALGYPSLGRTHLNGNFPYNLRQDEEEE